jgi:hypothetical protein
MKALKAQTIRLWIASRPLTAIGVIMLTAFVLSLVSVAAVPGEVLGAPTWLKPAKFAISSAIYALTFAWIFTFLGDWPRLKAIVGWTTALVLFIEVGIIDAQAARGLTSHFNVATTLDSSLFAIMGIAILIAWIAAILLTVAAFRQRFADEALGWAIRLGLLITVAGSATGGLMTVPSHEQLGSMRAGEHVTTSGSHTVGGPDGGPGLPGTGWSTLHGDIRVAHFLGLHGMQAIPLALWLARRRRPRAGDRSSVVIVSASYASLFGILLWEAMRAVPLTAPDGVTMAALAAWFCTTAIAILARRSQDDSLKGRPIRDTVVAL